MSSYKIYYSVIDDRIYISNVESYSIDKSFLSLSEKTFNTHSDVLIWLKSIYLSMYTSTKIPHIILHAIDKYLCLHSEYFVNILDKLHR